MPGWTKLPTPHAMVQHLDRFVHGQDRAKRDLALCVYRHYAAMAYRESHPELRHPFGKRHALLLGPTGSGKTYLVTTLAEFLGVPVAFVNATSLVETGYVGEHVDSIFRRLLTQTRGKVAQAERGIVFLDEIDKVRRQDVGGQRDVSGEGVQTSLLAPLDGCPIDLRGDYTGTIIDSAKVLFVGTGAFSGLATVIRRRLGAGRTMGFTADGEDYSTLSDDEALARGELQDLEAYGFIPEFLGRFAVISTVSSLSRTDLVAILRDTEDSPLRRQIRWFEQHGVRLVVPEETLAHLADLAIATRSNARGLERIVAKKLANLEWQLPELMRQGVCQITLTPEALAGSAHPAMRISDHAGRRPPIELLRSRAASLLNSAPGRVEAEKPRLNEQTTGQIQRAAAPKRHPVPARRRSKTLSAPGIRQLHLPFAREGPNARP